MTERWIIGAGGFIGEVYLCEPPPEAGPDLRRRPMLFMTDLWVHPLRRGRGWASELLHAATTWADSRRIDLWTYVLRFDDRPSAMSVGRLKALYEGRGFRPTGRKIPEPVLVRRWLST